MLCRALIVSLGYLCFALKIIFNCRTRGVARIFQRGGGGGVTGATRYVKQGHHPGIADYIWFIPLLSLVYQRAQSYYRGMKAHVNLKQEPLTELLYQKQILKKWAFQQWLLRPRYCHGGFAT